MTSSVSLSWTEYAQNLANSGSYTSAAITLLIPWSLLVAYGLYYWFFKRPCSMSRAAMGPFVTFYTLLTDGATAGYDKPLMRLFHPGMLKDGAVERGVLRAMTRCLCDRFGKVVAIPRDTVCLKRDGMQANCVALVDFERVKGVTCQLSWVTRLPSVRASERLAQNTTTSTSNTSTSPLERLAAVDGIGMVPLHTFHVTSFHIEPHTHDALDVLQYLQLDDFEHFAEKFVSAIFAQPPRAAIEAMVPALRKRYAADEGNQLQCNVQMVVRAAGGMREVDAVVSDRRVLRSEANPKAIDGIEMTYWVRGAIRHMEVYLRMTFVGMRCYVTRYELRIRPDERTQVVVDRDSGETTVVA